jgi:DNase/tRNase domain of colicin-like bacteriocin
MSSQFPPGSSQADYNRAQADLDRLESAYQELAVDTGLAAAGWAPPPWGTAADIASLGKSLFKRDWGGAVWDGIGLIPIAGDAAKAGKLGRKAKAIEAAINAARIKLVRQAAHRMAARRAAAKDYWRKVIAEGRKRFDEAIKSCSTQACKEKKVGLIGEHYKKTPVGGPGKGRWEGGIRGDGRFTPDPASSLGKELKKFSGNPALNPSGRTLDSIPYKDGHPDYSDFVVPAGAGKKAQVEIIQAGNHTGDFTAANDALKQATGKTKLQLEKVLGTKLTWHHKEDGVTMQLVPERVHGATAGSGHTGGAFLQKQEEF